MATILKSTCSFCIEPITKTKVDILLEDNNSITEYNYGEDKDVDVFLKLANRYTCALIQNEDTKRLTTVCCTDCLRIIKSFNKLYLEMECLKLKLDWKLEELKTRTEYANKVPSRFHRIITNATSEDKSDLLKDMLSFRRTFLKRCSTHLLKSTPKVILKRNQSSPNANVEEIKTSSLPITEDSSVEESAQIETEPHSCQVKAEPIQYILEDESTSVTNSFDQYPDEVPMDFEYQFPDIKPFHNQPHESLSTSYKEDSHKASDFHETQNNAKMFTCSDCPLTLANKGKLLRHKWFEHTHKGQQPRNQVIIPETSTTIGEWVNKTGAKFKCSEVTCTDATYMTEECLQDHSKLHGVFFCKFCEVVKNFAPDLATHELEMHGSLKGPCPRCDYKIPKQLPHEHYLNHHLLEHQNLFMDGCRCPICKQAFFSKAKRELVRSMLLHWLNFHDSSNACGTRARKTHKIKRKTDNKKVKIHQCQKCQKIFKDPYKLKRHCFALHKPLDSEGNICYWRFECKLCGEKFFDKFIFKRHQKTKHNLQDFGCQLCGTKFLNRNGLLQHNLINHSKKQKHEKSL